VDGRTYIVREFLALHEIIKCILAFKTPNNPVFFSSLALCFGLKGNMQCLRNQPNSSKYKSKTILNLLSFVEKKGLGEKKEEEKTITLQHKRTVTVSIPRESHKENPHNYWHMPS